MDQSLLISCHPKQKHFAVRIELGIHALNSRARAWIPASAGMTTNDAVSSRVWNPCPKILKGL
jgi:hypothetical protein